MEEKNYDLMMKLTRVEWLLHRYHQRNHMHFGPMGDPRRGQGRVLAILKMKPEISQRELSYLLDMRPQSLGELLSKLEKSGYITRTPSETDRRVMIIKLTQEGVEATGTTEQEFSFDKLFDCLSEEEQKNLSSYLDRIIENLESQVGDEQTDYEFDPRFQEHGNPFEGHFGGHHNPFDRGHFGRPEGRHFDPRTNHRMNRMEGGYPSSSKDNPEEK